MVPGLSSWALLLGFCVGSRARPGVMAPVGAALLLAWVATSISATTSAVRGYRRMRRHTALPWGEMLRDLERRGRCAVAPSDVVHAVILATWNESRAVLEPTVESVLAADYDMTKVILLLAYEERGGPDVERRAHQLVADHGQSFRYAAAVRHRDAPGEVVGKGANITAAGRALAVYLEAAGIDPRRVMVTTLDADNRPHRSYLAALTYAFCTARDPFRASFQPIPLYVNNVWHVPALVRLIATTGSLWNIALSVRPGLVRNASAHAQSMRSLLDMDFWSVRTVVEDGHQFWRSYFHHDGRYVVHPLSVPIHHDAVLSTTYRRTLRAQFTQLRRWAWGVSDIPYVIEKGYFTPNRVPKLDLTGKLLQLVAGHVLAAAGPPILASALVGAQLPLAAAGTLAGTWLVGLSVAVGIGVRVLPARPGRRDGHAWARVAAQCGLLPVMAALYGALPALNAQTRLLLGRRLETFDLTEKAVVAEGGARVS